ncbi:hypothetical protein [Pseudonocardia spirodelae]|uniref:Uncharacterized protein n=1 Tax=Pseudonocardia spirodelae TaxID=3133431 RepID=A0ABU8T2T9_9PSEU
MGTFIGFWFIGALIAGMAFRVRAGLGMWSSYRMLGDGGLGVEWTLITVGKTFVWPVVLAYWLLNDRPEPRIVFNEKAARRRQEAERLAGAPPQAPGGEDPADTGVAVLGSGRRLRTMLDLPGCLALLEQLADPPRPGIPPVLPATWQWRDDAPAPEASVSFTAGGTVIVAAFWPEPDRTVFGLYPVDDGPDRLIIPLIGHWKQIDTSLGSIGTLDAGTYGLLPPRPVPGLVPDILTAAGLPVEPAGLADVGERMQRMVLGRAGQFLAVRDATLAARFAEEHRTSDPDVILRALAVWDPGVVPHLQDLYFRARAILLETTPDGRPAIVALIAGTLSQP